MSVMNADPLGGGVGVFFHSRLLKMRGGEMTEKAKSDFSRGFISIPEASRKLSVSRAHMYQLVREGQIRSYSFGRRAFRVRVEDLEEYVKSSAQNCRRSI